MKHPELKREFQSMSILQEFCISGIVADALISFILAAWAERSKQIAKIWRGLPAEARAPFLQQARENRAASRMQKAQQVRLFVSYYSTFLIQHRNRELISVALHASLFI
jgi:hypothetical protein